MTFGKFFVTFEIDKELPNFPKVFHKTKFPIISCPKPAHPAVPIRTGTQSGGVHLL